MSTTPPIQYSGPAISSEVPWEVRQHLQLIYQKFSNHTQAMSLLKQQGTSTATTSTVIEGLAGGSGGAISTAGIGVNDQSSQTSYSTMAGDNGSLILFSDSGAIAVSLTSQTPPWGAYIANIGALGQGTVTLTPAVGTINGSATLAILPTYWALVAFDGSNWWAATLPIVPEAFTAVSHEFLTAYDAATGVFAAAQPAFADISGNLSTSQLPTAGLSVTITTAALTPTGSEGSMTFTNGILTAQTPAT